MTLLFRLAASLALLTAILLWLEPQTLLAAFAAPEPLWLAAALTLTIPQVALSAWRWRITAGRLGAPLGSGEALCEYYVATFLNQILPGGVMGDATRAWRHARRQQTRASTTPPPGAAAWHAVIIERASGQLALLLVVLAALALAPELRVATAELLAVSGHGPGWITLAPMLLTIGGIAWWRGRAHIHRLRVAVREALLAREVFMRQVLASLLIVASYVGVYLCCMRMIGIDTPMAQAAPLVPWVLLAMAIPLSIAGWGVREGAAALLWQAVGLDPAEGVAISISYGVVILLSSLPGALILLHHAVPGAVRRS
ncbi:MAG TPA: lysylphosphatidylglycerol synthetase family protein [Thauera sp.]|nr:lysylphosphatidylglycerol synthetase family protein [Thauera sp.]HHW65712.1 flippase-like domain-containing protein [Rhodocyclaceae bacterium]